MTGIDPSHPAAPIDVYGELWLTDVIADQLEHGRIPVHDPPPRAGHGRTNVGRSDQDM